MKTPGNYLKFVPLPLIGLLGVGGAAWLLQAVLWHGSSPAPATGPRGSALQQVAGHTQAAARALTPASRPVGEGIYRQSCAACHGPDGRGLPHQGANLRDSLFVRTQNDQALVAFLKAGRSPGDPRSVMGLFMPPRGGNPSLTDRDVRDVAAFLRILQSSATATGEAWHETASLHHGLPVDGAASAWDNH